MLQATASLTSGAVACLHYLRLGKFDIPRIVNCSGRYRTSTILDKYEASHKLASRDAWRNVKQLPETWLVNKQLVTRHTPPEELFEIASYDEHTLPASFRRACTQMLVVFGDEDHIVDPQDAWRFARLFPHTSNVVIVEGADHNFFQTRDGKKHNLNPRVVEAACQWLGDEAEARRAEHLYGLSRHIRNVDHVFNVRDIGPLPCAAAATTPAGAERCVRSGLIYRSADPGRASEQGRRVLRDELAIQAVFDLRSHTEREQHMRKGDPLDPITQHHVPVFDDGVFDPVALVTKFLGTRDPERLLYHVNIDILEHAGPAYASVVRFLLRNPGAPILVHCTGKKHKLSKIY